MNDPDGQDGSDAATGGTFEEALEMFEDGFVFGSDPLVNPGTGSDVPAGTATDEEILLVIEGLDDPVTLKSPDADDIPRSVPSDVDPAQFDAPLVNPGVPADDLWG